MSMSTTEVNNRDWVALEHQYYQSTFKRQPVTFVRGEGTRVWDSDGKMYLDLVAGIAVNVLGHCHPAIIEAVQYQVTQLVHVSNLYYNTRQIELAEQLGLLSDGMRSFFSNSGAEANEGAIKLARKYGRLHRNGAYEIISMERSFHGRTLATTSATGQAYYQATWVPLADGFKQTPFNDLEALKAATSEKTVGVLIEAVQGEGGIYPGTQEFVQGMRQWCDEQNLVEHAAQMGTYWHARWEGLCKKYHFIDSPRGLGLMQAVNVQHELAPAIVQQALEHGLLLNNLGPGTLRMIPPLILKTEDIDEATELLDRALTDVANMPVAQA